MGTDGVGRSSSDDLVLQLPAQRQRIYDTLRGWGGDGTDGGFETYRRIARGIAMAQRDAGWGEGEAGCIGSRVFSV